MSVVWSPCCLAWRMRHLAPPLVIGALRRGAEVEQLLERRITETGAVLRWLNASAVESGYRLRLHTVLDVHQEMSTFDVYAYPPVDEDAEEWDNFEDVGQYATPDELLAAAERHGANPLGWVNEGLIGEELMDVLAAGQ